MNMLLTKTAPESALSIKKIVVAVDLSADSEVTARYAIGIAKPFAASIVLVHVHAATNQSEFVTEELGMASIRRQQQAGERLTNLTKRLEDEYASCTERFLVGEPAEEIARVASELNADLIVTASHHPSMLGRLFNLAQAPRIIRRAPCSVLVYYHKEI
jgi:nucleotide-binding universal stress UspA family protein